jgi:uncharacterized membrane-anchored protein YitT (DUF2179 family)
MKNLFKRLIRSQLHIRHHHKDELSEFLQAKAIRNLKIVWFENIKDFILVVLGILSAGFGLQGFLLPNGFVDGGAMGIALVLARLVDIQLAYLIVAVNIPFIMIGYRTISKIFSLKTFSAIVLLALAVAFIPYPIITHDKTLIAVFGGFFLGIGIGFAVRGGCVIDGTEVMAIQISRTSTLTIGDVILIFNILIFSAAAFEFGIEAALYSVLTYLTASKTVDFVIEGIEEYTGVTIVSAKHDDIREMIVHKMGRGLTIYNGERGYGKRGYNYTEVKIIYTVITRLEISKLNVELEKIDPSAFVVMSSVKDTKGGMIKKRMQHTINRKKPPLLVDEFPEHVKTL